MQLLLIRHAPTETRESFSKRTGLDDSLRPLSARGLEKMRQNIKGLHSLMPRLTLIISSPAQRALETSELLRAAYPKADFQESPLLQTGGTPETLCRWLQTLSQAKSKPCVALVGHEPDLSQLAGWFLSGQAVSFITFKKGAACLLDFPNGVDGGKGLLQWLLTPAQLRGLRTRSV